MATSASEAAKAVNALMGFSSDALLEVLQDYFSSPDGPERDDWDWEGDDSSDDDIGASGLWQGTSRVYTPITLINNIFLLL